MTPRVAAGFGSSTSSPSVFTQCSRCLRRDFSSSPSTQTRQRKLMFAWLQGIGSNLQYPLPKSTNYLTCYNRKGALYRELDPPMTRYDFQPFPLNKQFQSQPILSETLRQEVWRRVQVEGKSVRAVSVELNIEMRRVGAVVRLVEIENRMRAEGKPLALPYARAIHDMVPVTDRIGDPHEPIHDLPVHPLTDPQIFYPTSESRAFNRTDAGRVFSAAPRLPDSQDIAQGGSSVEPWRDTKPEKVGKGETEIDILKPADARIPHPHMIAYNKDTQNPNTEWRLAQDRHQQRLQDDTEARQKARQQRFEQEEARKTRVDTNRWQFVVTDVKVSRDTVGKTGRGTRAPGVRYGAPFEDRKRGQIKIPTKVQV